MLIKYLFYFEEKKTLLKTQNKKLLNIYRERKIKICIYMYVKRVLDMIFTKTPFLINNVIQRCCLD